MSKINLITFLLIVFQLLQFSVFGQPDSRIVELEQDLSKEKNDSLRIYLMSEIAYEYEAISLEKSLFWYDKAIALAKKSNSIYWLSKNYGYKAIALQFMLEYDSSVVYNQKAIQLAEQRQDTVQQVKLYCNLGKTYYENDKIVSAIGMYKKALGLAKKIDNKWLMATSYRGIGVCYRKMQNHRYSLMYHKSALELDLQMDSPRDLAMDYANIAVAYQDLKEWDKANGYLENAIKTYKDLGMQGEELAILYNNQASGESERNNHEKALNLFFKAKEQFLLSKEKGSVPFVNKNIASAYLALGKIELARIYIDSALLQLSMKANPRITIHAQLILAEILMNQSDFQRASQLLLNTYNQKDSLEASFQKREIEELEIKFQTKEKDIQLQQSETERKKKDAELSLQKSISERRQIVVFSLVGIGGLLLFLFLNVRRSNIRTKKANEQISMQKDELVHQKKVIEEKSEEITSSIRYAQSIQNAILPQQPLIDSFFPRNFVLYLPKDLVAGDFYWFEKHSNHLFFAAADCTGHGVPGAMVSVVCHNALNQAVREYKLTNSAEILNKTKELVIKTFEKSETDIKDGMDISLCVLDTSTNELQFSGANNSLLIVREGELIKLKGDRQPIGYSHEMKSFTTHNIQLKEKDRIYAFSDGYSDQFGGEKGKKFRSKNLEELLLSIQDLPLAEQKNVLLDTFNSWRGSAEQTDDVCVVGVEVV